MEDRLQRLGQSLNILNETHIPMSVVFETPSIFWSLVARINDSIVSVLPRPISSLNMPPRPKVGVFCVGVLVATGRGYETDYLDRVYLLL